MPAKPTMSIRSAVATVLCAAAGLAAAAESTPAPAKMLAEVVVTAQKRTERLIDVPVAITAVSSESLTKENLVSMADYFSRIPDLQYNCRQTYCLSLRGVTTGGANNPTLAILIDDVPFGSALAAGLGNSRFPDLDPSSLERIEVLRGPQGTLYGASSLGGLVKYVTREPSTDEFSARIDAGMATIAHGSSGWNVRGSVNLPFASDRAALSVSGFNREDAPYIDNVEDGFQGTDVNNTHIYGGQAAFIFKFTDDLSIELTALRQKREADYSSSVLVEVDADGVPTFEPVYGKNTISLSTTRDVGDQELYTGAHRVEPRRRAADLDHVLEREFRNERPGPLVDFRIPAIFLRHQPQLVRQHR